MKRRMSLADSVLALVLWEYDRRSMKPAVECFCIEGYVNGREHGYCIKSWDFNIGIAFAEDRKTDKVVVYTGPYHDFDMAGNVPSQAVYARAVREDVQVAADEIMDQIMGVLSDEPA